MDTDAGPLKVVAEYCPPSPHKSKLFFGRAAKSIQGGAWQTGIYPQLPGDLKKDYEEIYKISYLSIDHFIFNISLLIQNKEGYILTYIYPASPNRPLQERVISSAFSTNIFQTPTLNSDYPAEEQIAQCYALNKIVYSDNQTAQDFQDCIKAELTNPLSLY